MNEKLSKSYYYSTLRLLMIKKKKTIFMENIISGLA